MNVLLIQLYDGGEVPPVYPLGLAYLASCLDGHNVHILDQNTVQGDVFGETARQAQVLAADVVGVSIRNFALYSARRRCSLFQDQLQRTVEAVRAARPGVVVVAGGATFSLFPRRFMEAAPGIDFGVYLEGEETFPLLLRNLRQPDKVPGLFWRDAGGLRFNAVGAPPAIDRLRAPRRDLVPVTPYRGLDGVGVLSKRGCPLACSYCAYPALSGHAVRLRPPAEVGDEIEDLVTRWGVREFTFADNVFNIPLDHAKAVCAEIARRRLAVQWSAWFNERFLDDELLKAAADAGCIVAELSPDGYTAASLRWLNKNITTADIRRGVRLFRKQPSISVFYNFVTGVPRQGPLSWARRGLFVLWAKALLGPRFLGVNYLPLMVLPHTQLQQVALAEGVIDEGTDLLGAVRYERGLLGGFRRLATRHPWIHEAARTVRGALCGQPRTPAQARCIRSGGGDAAS